MCWLVAVRPPINCSRSVSFLRAVTVASPEALSMPAMALSTLMVPPPPYVCPGGHLLGYFTPSLMGQQKGHGDLGKKRKLARCFLVGLRSGAVDWGGLGPRA